MIMEKKPQTFDIIEISKESKLLLEYFLSVDVKEHSVPVFLKGREKNEIYLPHKHYDYCDGIGTRQHKEL